MKRAANSGIRRRVTRLLRYWRWNRVGDHTLRARIYYATLRRYRWWDWGHIVMTLVGTPIGGNYQEPQPKTLWYRWEANEVQKARTYDEYRTASASQRENDWKWIGWDQDNELRLGYYTSQSFYGLVRREQRMLFWWLVRWYCADWFGLRTWLYSKALHAAVHQKIPFRCQAQPRRDRAQGGYSHWYCQLPKRHDGMHRFNNYVWGDIEGEPIGAYLPRQETGT